MNILRFDRDISLQTSGESCAIGEFNMHLGTVRSIFVDGDEAHDFVAEFFTMNHRYLIPLSRSQRSAGICVLVEIHRVSAGSDLLWGRRDIADETRCFGPTT